VALVSAWYSLCSAKFYSPNSRGIYTVWDAPEKCQHPKVDLVDQIMANLLPRIEGWKNIAPQPSTQIRPAAILFSDMTIRLMSCVMSAVKRSFAKRYLCEIWWHQIHHAIKMFDNCYFNGTLKSFNDASPICLTVTVHACSGCLVSCMRGSISGL